MTEKRELIFGTGNRAKIDQVQGALQGTGIIVKSVKEFSNKLPEVEEDGNTAIENARKKAVTYAKAIGRTVFSMDNALYFDDIDVAKQPGLFVRRINGVEASTDDELLQHYSSIIREHNGRLNGYWQFAIAIAQPDGSSVEDVIESHRQFVAEPSKMIVPGYPLESIQIDPESGKYVSEMSEQEQADFWQAKIGTQLKEFVTTNL